MDSIVSLKVAKSLSAFLFLSLSAGCLWAADETENERTPELWGQFTEKGARIFDKSVQSFNGLLNDLDALIDRELAKLSREGDDVVDLREKIDALRLRVDEVADLKRRKTAAPEFAFIAKSKKDYQIEIDEVLEEIEPILFDGEIVDYAGKIRKARATIQELNEQKARLNEALAFAPEEGGFLKDSKSDIADQINAADDALAKSRKLIDRYEYDLTRKMADLGVDLSREQVRVMTTRVDGDELSKAFAIFDVTRQISDSLAELMQQNAFSGRSTVKYYGIYVIMSELLAYSQKEYIRKIDDVYLPSLQQVQDNMEAAIGFAQESIAASKSPSNIAVFESNIEANRFSLIVLSQYRQILVGQREQLKEALAQSMEQIRVAYSTYDTAANSANLVALIDQTRTSFDKIMNMQIPNIVPFENAEVELKFREISDQIVAQGS